MKNRCPACKRLNIDTSECSRCGCDFSLLLVIDQKAQIELTKGIEKLKEKDGIKAFEHASRSWLLKKTSQAARLGFLAALMVQCEHSIIKKWYLRASQS